MRGSNDHRAHACMRVHGRLARFVAPHRRGAWFRFAFDGRPALKDPVEAAGVPHTEVVQVLVDGEPASLSTRLRGGEHVEVHPVERQQAGDPPRFVLDVHLGRLARDLRLLGIDAAWQPGHDDDALQACAAGQRRVLLTRDVGLLKRTDVPAGAFVYVTDPAGQLSEVLSRFGLAAHLRPYTRCSRCNAPVDAVEAAAVAAQVPARVLDATRRFSRCRGCLQVYWRGTHEAGLRERLAVAGVDFVFPDPSPVSHPPAPHEPA
ncbi:Mut7-C RNAse domain-containing protein [Lysobacter sp. N42]|uniref:Mut7-C RNAse domain-containing protein n=1 Tax=Lysobacter sp. N42 TaxID=2545719 RepID=UPI001053607B|nr:Mut7-C RNAse domain-containing protein [Lysobacter sp. N42]TCZ87366.1 twitching motility protein PilT [Lysobacter sp. N42]